MNTFRTVCLLLLVPLAAWASGSDTVLRPNSGSDAPKGSQGSQGSSDCLFQASILEQLAMAPSLDGARIHISVGDEDFQRLAGATSRHLDALEEHMGWRIKRMWLDPAAESISIMGTNDQALVVISKSSEAGL